MRLYINERSLAEPHLSVQHVTEFIADFLRARAEQAPLRRAIYCTKLLPNLTLGDGKPLNAAVQALPSSIRTLFFTWAANLGPFTDDEREDIENDLFFFEADEVTDEGLGEAARQLLQARPAGSYSFATESGRFAATLLNVIQGFSDEPINEFKVPNFWAPDVATAALAASAPEPSSWTELLSQCRERFPNLEVGNHCDEILSRYPFEPNVSRRTIELLGVLNFLVGETGADGALSPAGIGVHQQHFVGAKAWFSDESDGNKHEFAQEMTFPNPDRTGPPLTCFWHGKIKTPQYRIHFEWPMSAPFNKLRVAYIGPKIPKK